MITAVINARIKSERLPEKHLLKIGNKSLFEHVIDQLSLSKIVSQIYLATGPKKKNHKYVNFLKKRYPKKIKYFHHDDEFNVTKRIHLLSKKISTKYTLLISGDCPLLDLNFIHRLYDALKSNPSYDFIKTKKVLIHEGIELFKTSAWEKVFMNSSKKIFKENPGYILKFHPKNFNIIKYNHLAYENQKKFRISVDTQSDIEFLNYLYLRLKKKGKKFCLKNILKLKKINILNNHVWQRKPGEKKINIKIITNKNYKVGLGNFKRAQFLRRELSERYYCSTEIIILNKNIKKKISNFQLDDIIIIDLNYDDLNKLTSSISKFKKVLIVDNLINKIKFKTLIPNYIIPNPRKNIYGGLNYLILDRKINYTNLTYVNNSKKIQKLLIIGGSFSIDPEINEFMNLNKKKLKIIVGPFVKKSTIKRLIKDKFKLIINPTNIYSYIKSSKEIFSRFGVSVFECVALKKKPIVFLKYNLKDKKIINTLYKKKYISIYKKKKIKIKKNIDIQKCYLNFNKFFKENFIK